MVLRFIVLSVLGIILGALYIKTRSLIVPIAFHALNNIIAVLPQLLPRNSSSSTSTLTLQSLQSSWWIGVVMMGISLPLLLRFLWKNYPRKDTSIPYLTNAKKQNIRV